jgi:perosamine synthetase
MNYIARTKLSFGHKEIIGAVTSVIEREKGDKFREEIKSFVGCIDVKLFNQGRTALYTALRAINIKESDKIILPAFCCLVVPEMILRLGAKPIMVDVDSKTFNIDVEEIKENLDAKTKAIIPIHLFGQPADIGAIMEIAEDNNVYVIEDSAQAMGAEYEGKKVGSFGHASIFSLGHGKNITTGEGGVLTINDESLKNNLNKLYDSVGNARTRKALSNLSKQIGYSILSHPFLYRVIQAYMDNTAKKRDNGFLKTVEELYKKNPQKFTDEVTMSMSNIIAAIGLVQFNKLDYFNQKRIENAKYLSKRIKHEGVSLPYEGNNCKHVFLRYAIRIDENELGLSRDKLLKIFRSNGIDAETPYLYVREHNAVYKNNIDNKVFPVSDELVDSVICLPVHPCLGKNDLEHIIRVFAKL